ncbi:hypothetical protein ACD591_18370 [Rufibacter glacialis]|uniref:S46 family peptidase n=1 Tax=Rufibacter glacialis TaxID=1259555 RepID=A0A5M8Q6S8_9BACT|nr:S46 family peptidase [Rufibacter glacialis]KAA6430808.1 S46 family peptidase [Rufibacter glacialis]GGK86869.1 hypothetical protein GCM10011405_38330 [Rufibacter glacialis]
MKNFTLSVSLFFALAFTASAQVAPANPSVEKATISISRLMVQEMGLNEVEYIQVRNLNQERLLKAAEATRQFQNDAPTLEASLEEIDRDFENKLFKILNNRQVEAYAEFKTKPEANFLSLVQQVSPRNKKKD